MHIAVFVKRQNNSTTYLLSISQSINHSSGPLTIAAWLPQRDTKRNLLTVKRNPISSRTMIRKEGSCIRSDDPGKLVSWA